jgi:hypothetical protein
MNRCAASGAMQMGNPIPFSSTKNSECARLADHPEYF